MGLIRFLLIVLGGWLVYTWFRKTLAGPSRRPVDHAEDDRIGRLVQDPQCGVYIDSREAVRRKVGGEDRFFCSTDCAEKYAAAYAAAHKAEGS
ncbi:MAG: hypothetical protein HY423_16745 [Candidatus Lambdaproteobacteria bacterium]|nr:hypothetical protein [Candidatus Lambdaproteobacteria bacterium]